MSRSKRQTRDASAPGEPGDSFDLPVQWRLRALLAAPRGKAVNHLYPDPSGFLDSVGLPAVESAVEMDADQVLAACEQKLEALGRFTPRRRGAPFDSARVLGGMLELTQAETDLLCLVVLAQEDREFAQLLEAGTPPGLTGMADYLQRVLGLPAGSVRALLSPAANLASSGLLCPRRGSGGFREFYLEVPPLVVDALMDAFPEREEVLSKFGGRVPPSALQLEDYEHLGAARDRQA